MDWLEIIQHPAVWMVLGMAAKAIFPASVPFLGMGRKLVEELTELHEKSEVKNETIKEEAAKAGLTLATKQLAKKLS